MSDYQNRNGYDYFVFSLEPIRQVNNHAPVKSTF